MLQPKPLSESLLSASGIVPRACSDVLTAIHQRRAQGVRAVLRISYVEIYGEQVCCSAYVSIRQHASACVSVCARTARSAAHILGGNLRRTGMLLTTYADVC
jgi:hypothetical protein